MAKNVLWAAIGIAIALAVASGLVSVEAFLLDQFGLVYPSAGIDIGTWLDSFKTAAVLGIATAMILVLMWDGIAYFSSGRKSDRRRLWEMLVAFSGGISALICFYLPLGSQSALWPTVFGFLGGTICFLVATIPFTPEPLKYSPWLASMLRLRANARA
jgi:hypothetical protein